MLNIVSALIGLVLLPFAIIGLLPVVGLVNWLVIPVALLGAGIGMLSRGTAGRNLNLLVLLIAIVRLSLTGGFF